MKNISAAAKALGRLGGLKGGKARAAKLTSEQRIAIAKKAAAKRWAKKDSPSFQPKVQIAQAEGHSSFTVLQEATN